MRLEPLRNRQALLAEKSRVEEAALVAGAVIGEDRDDRMTGAHVAREANSACDVNAARAAEAEAFLAQ